MQASKIPYVDLVSQHASIKGELLREIEKVIDSGQFILGDQVRQFEDEFARLCGTRYAVGVNSGTDALIFALRAIGVGQGDEVITVPNSFIASTSCIRLLGAKPVFVDVGEDYNMDPGEISAAITEKTKAIIPVHLTGRPCNMSAIMDIANKAGIHVVEDSAQAVMAAYKGKMVGAWGSVGCFSLHPLKTLNACGDGGVLTTDDPDIYQQLMLMRNLGLKTRDDCVMWTTNSRLDTIQAAILLVKLKYLQQWTEQRRENADLYQSLLADLTEVTFPFDDNDTRSVYHTFVAQVENRDELKMYLETNGISTAIHYPVPIHMSTVGRELGYGAGSFPRAEAQAQKILSLPIYAGLEKGQIERVCECIHTFYNR
jgi:dTDP-4-amino-4,6-dideoxygalactose transaminase